MRNNTIGPPIGILHQSGINGKELYSTDTFYHQGKEGEMAALNTNRLHHSNENRKAAALETKRNFHSGENGK